MEAALRARYLHSALMGDTATFLQCVGAGVNLTATDQFGNTALHVSVSREYMDITQIILERSLIEVNARNLEGETPVMKTVFCGNAVRFVKYLVDTKHADLSLCDNHGRHLIHIAAERGHFRLVRHLIDDRNVDMKLRTLQMKNILMCAIASGNREVVKYIQARDPEQLEETDAHGNRPIHIAVAGQSTLMVEALLEIGADLTSRDSHGRNAREIASQSEDQVIALLISQHASILPPRPFPVAEQPLVSEKGGPISSPSPSLSPPSENFICNLDGEIIHLIFCNLDHRSLVNLSKCCRLFAFPQSGSPLSPTEYAAKEISRRVFLGWELHLLEFGKSWKWLLHLAEKPQRPVLIEAVKMISEYVTSLEADVPQDSVRRGRALLAIANLQIKVVLAQQLQTRDSGLVAENGMLAARKAVEIFEKLVEEGSERYWEEYCSSLLRLGTLSSFYFDHLDGPLAQRGLMAGALERAAEVVRRAAAEIERAKSCPFFKHKNSKQKFNWALLEVHLMIVQGQFVYAQDQFEKAVEIYRRALAVLLQLVGEKHLLTGEILQKLGRSYEMGARDLSGGVEKYVSDLREAKMCYARSAATRMERLGRHHPDTSMVLDDHTDVVDKLAEIARQSTHVNFA